jgi:hypothetical protein
MGIPDTYVRNGGQEPVWIESVQAGDGARRLEVRNVLEIRDLMDSVNLDVTSEVLGMLVPQNLAHVGVRMTYQDVRKLRDRLDEILSEHQSN